MRQWFKVFCMSLVCFFLFMSPVFSEETQAPEGDFGGIGELVDLLKEKGVLNEEEAARFLEKYGQKNLTGENRDRTSSEVPEEPGRSQADTVSEEVFEKLREDLREQLKEEIKIEVAEHKRSAAWTNEWARRIRWGGDMRLRYEGNFFDESNITGLARPDDPTQVLNTTEDRNRGRIRVRLTAKAKVTEKVEVGLRISTGNEKNPVSTNETLGDYNTNDGIVFERAYLKWSPVPGLSFQGGRMPNPWFHSDLVWDPDINFEGVAVTGDRRLTDAAKGFFALGYFPIQEVELSSHDKWLLGAQVGMQYRFHSNLTAKLGVAYYNYENIEGEVNDPLLPGETDFTAPLFQQKGNTLIDIDPSGEIKTALASDYDALNITGNLDLGFFDPVHIVFMGDYVKNIGFDRDKAAVRTGNPDLSEETAGYQVGFSVGYPKIRDLGDWRFFMFYKHLEADAVLDSFTDSDFHLGGTNAEGWILGGELGLTRNLWLKTRWLTADEIEGPPLAFDVFQVDLNVRF